MTLELAANRTLTHAHYVTDMAPWWQGTRRGYAICRPGVREVYDQAGADWIARSGLVEGKVVARLPLCKSCVAKAARDGLETPVAGRLPYRRIPARYAGSDPERQSVGDPGHCEDCVSVGHALAHPDFGCADVGCYESHEPVDPGDDLDRAIRDRISLLRGRRVLDKAIRDRIDLLRGRRVHNRAAEEYAAGLIAVLDLHVARADVNPSLCWECGGPAGACNTRRAIADALGVPRG